MKTTNRTILDLSKVQHGSFWYVNQYGQVKIPSLKDSAYTVRLQDVCDTRLALYHPDYPGETELARAKRLGCLDTWTPVCSFQLTANHCITYTGKKAIAMWRAWNERIFNKQKGK